MLHMAFMDQLCKDLKRTGYNGQELWMIISSAGWNREGSFNNEAERARSICARKFFVVFVEGHEDIVVILRRRATQDI